MLLIFVWLVIVVLAISFIAAGWGDLREIL
jgi:hypothetical protein